LEPAWFVPGPTLPWLEGFAELGLVLAPVVVPDFMFDSDVIDDLWCLCVICLCVIACAVDIGLASPAITSAATAHLIFVMERSPWFDDAKNKSVSLQRFPLQSICRRRLAGAMQFGTEGHRRNCCCGTAEHS
jgi:hypothetical protein